MPRAKLVADGRLERQPDGTLVPQRINRACMFKRFHTDSLGRRVYGPCPNGVDVVIVYEKRLPYGRKEQQLECCRFCFEAVAKAGFCPSYCKKKPG